MSYYDWVKTFEMLKTSPMDEKIIDNLQNKKLGGNDYVFNRFVDHVIKTINARLNTSYYRCIDQILSSNSDIDSISIDLINLKKEKKFVLKIVNLPIFHEEVRDTFVRVINQNFDEIYTVLRKYIEYRDIDGEYISVFEKIMSSNMED